MMPTSHSALPAPALVMVGLILALMTGCGVDQPVRSINPGAEEIDRPNVILILVDTLRADHLGTYGYHRETSPRIDQSAESDGLVFERALGVAPWTNPTIASLFTGAYPQSVFEAAGHQEAIRQVLPQGTTTLAERLQANGYRTIGMVDHPGITESLGYARGFDTFVRFFKELETPSWQDTPADFVLRRLEEVLAEDSQKPVFLYLHLVYPHRPYAAPEPYRTLFGPRHKTFEEAERDRMINSYDAEIRYTDDLIGDVEDQLRGSGFLRRTWRILISDHGEEFWEHGQAEHGGSFHDELIHVPMIFWPPDGSAIAPRRIGQTVSLIDIHPTILELGGVEPDPDLAGISLVSLFEGSPPATPRTLFSESPHKGQLRRASVVDGNYKLIDEIDSTLVYDLASDPEEKTPATIDPKIERKLLQELRQHRRRNRDRLKRLEAGDSQAIEPDAETVERLRALGYVDS